MKQSLMTDEEIAREAAIKIVNESSCISDELGGIQDIILDAIIKSKKNEACRFWHEQK